MLRSLPESVLLTRPQHPPPVVVLDVGQPGGLEAAVQDALGASGLRQGMVAIVLVSLGATPPSWSTGISVLGPNDAGEGLVIDTLAHEVSLRGLPVALTMKEFALLQYLYERRGILVSREELLRDVWGGSYNGGARTVDIHIRRLRAKLAADWFETVRGHGYRFRRAR